MKRKATDNSAAPPAQILRTELDGVAEGVLAKLPDRLNARKMIQRQRLRNLPAAPRTIDELGEIPDKFRITKKGESFLIYDSLEDEDYDLPCGRIIVFSTRENLRQLMKARFWFVDGTFKTAPDIFFQLFTISGSATQVVNGKEQTVALPFVYSLLEGKHTVAYSKVFDVVLQKCHTYEVRVSLPDKVLSDFELAIINSAKEHFGDRVRACFFHLRSNIWKHIQIYGLQTAYNDENDRSIKEAAQMMCTLAFVPAGDVVATFDLLAPEFPEDFLPIADYFEVIHLVSLVSFYEFVFLHKFS